jgi:peptidoglycan-N-acetylglucosamine deacetylase
MTNARDGGRPGRMLLRVAAIVLVAVLLLGVAAYRLHDSRTKQLFGELVAAVTTTERVVALTFDDGPVAPHTDSILELLRREQVRATFFVIGSAVARQPELARRIVGDGHELGNHSFSHRPLLLTSPRTIRREVETTDSLIIAVGGGPQVHFRPPYGKRLIVLPWYLARTGRTTVLWSIEPDTWHRDHAAMVQHVADNVRPGTIILLHVEIGSRVEERAALPLIIHELKRRGYRFVTVSELMRASADSHRAVR